MDQRLDELLQRCTVKLSVPGRMGHGTGFFVAPGLILTCAHVVKAAGFEPVNVCWQNQDKFADAVTECLLPDPFDLALLRFSPTVPDLSCVYLDALVQPDDNLHSYGYPDDFPKGGPVTFECEGLTGDEPPLIKFKAGQARPGLSGSPLLNQRTGKVCGIVKFTRDRSPEEIAQTYTSVTLEQVYATILYYLQNQETISEYMRNWTEHGHRMREEQRRNPPPVSKKLRQLRAERKAMKQANEPQIPN